MSTVSSLQATILVIEDEPDLPSDRDVDPRFEERRRAWARRDRLKRVEDMGFDDALLVVPDDGLDQLEAMRALA